MGSLQLQSKAIRFLHDIVMAERNMGSVDATAGAPPLQLGLLKAVHSTLQAMISLVKGRNLIAM